MFFLSSKLRTNKREASGQLYSLKQWQMVPSLFLVTLSVASPWWQPPIKASVGPLLLVKLLQPHGLPLGFCTTQGIVAGILAARSWESKLPFASIWVVLPSSSQSPGIHLSSKFSRYVCCWTLEVDCDSSLLCPLNFPVNTGVKTVFILSLMGHGLWKPLRKFS